MNGKTFKQKFKYFFQYFPFTLNTLLCGIAGWWAWGLLNKAIPKDEPAPFLPFIILMGKMAFWFLVVLIVLSVISTIFNYLYYLLLRHDKNYTLAVSFNTESRNRKKNRLYLSASLEGALRPMLGFVKGRLLYDDYEMTDKFSLLGNKRKEQSIWRVAVTGRSRLMLPDIKEYELKGGFIYFEDMLHIFSLAVEQPVSGHFYQPPVLTEEEDREVSPKKTETMDVRIEQLRRVEGEYLNYKDFESGDDVRRIVWKVYARNRELVVRVPELFEPYASHLYFYASFYAPVKTQWMGEGYLKEMLNYYKNRVWTIYDTLAKKEWEMRYVSDQSFSIPGQLSKAEYDARVISNSIWHRDKPLSQYFSAKKAAVLCVSCLTDPVELQNVLELCDASTVVYFVKASQVFRHFVAWNWIKRLIFLPPKDRLAKLRTRWIFSPMRLNIQKRERELEDILRKSSVSWGEL